MAKRKYISEQVVVDLLIACRRRCCICYFLDEEKGRTKGQVAHVNHRADDGRPDNLVWLCLNHHDEYDGKTRLSKGLTQGEIRNYRDQLVAVMRDAPPEPARSTGDIAREVVADMARSGKPGADRGWHFPLWLAADQPELFAYHAPGADGICAIERVDLPDGRIVIACIEMPGNPGRSITNAAEDIYAQVCKRFSFGSEAIVWLEHYESFEDEWREVRFAAVADGSLRPSWTRMTPPMWAKLGLSPRASAIETGTSRLGSKIDKHFPWPPPGGFGAS